MTRNLNVSLAKKYDQWHTKVYQTGYLEKTDSRDVVFYNFILDLLGVKDNQKCKKKILDVACGKGLFLREALKRSLEIYGIDISKVAIKKAKQFIKGNFCSGNAENLSYKDNSFDYVTCLGSLEHFTHPDIGVKEIAMVLKNDGKAIIYVPNLMFVGHIYMAWRCGIMPTEGKQSFSEVFYTYRGWKELLEENGLRVVDCQKYNRIYATKKVNKIFVFIWEYLFRFFIPINLSYCFLFLCKKNDQIYQPV